MKNIYFLSLYALLITTINLYAADYVVDKTAVLSRCLFKAIECDTSAEDAMKFIVRGADVNASGVDDNTPLIESARKGYIEFIDALARHGANINAQNRYGSTALHCAAECNQRIAVQLLLSLGADPKLQNSDQETPADTAHKKGHQEITCMIDSNEISSAIASDNTEKVRKIVTRSGINLSNRSGKTPLHYAVRHSSKTMAREFISLGANVNARTTTKQTPLHFAAKLNRIIIARELLSHDADVHAEDFWKQTPLHLAAQNGHSEMVKFLLECGANPKQKNSTHATALDIAEINGFVDLANYIRSYEDIPITKGAIMEDMGN